MQVKIGDNVRYLNAVGGGRVVRISGDIAYVDEDGFETPVLMRECVVVGAVTKNNNPISSSTLPVVKAGHTPEAKTKSSTVLPVVETVHGDNMNVVLGFEASTLTALSQASFDAYIVNDSNYYIYVSIAVRESGTAQWTLRYDGLIEPNIQEFVGECTREDIPYLDRILVQYVAFKRGRSFESKTPVSVELNVDGTKFAKAHCFRSNPYFDVPVLAFDIVSDDKASRTMDTERAVMEHVRASSKDVPARPKKSLSRPSKRGGIIEVDLHIDELVDTTAGLSSADMLNLQIDHFRRVMDENVRNVGQKIVFIHGKGDGVLRHALMKELTHRYKGHDVQDASFREYGFGATQVTIKSVKR